MVQQMCTSEKKSKRVNITGISFPDVYILGMQLTTKMMQNTMAQEND